MQERRLHFRHRFRPAAPVVSMRCNELGRIIRIVHIIGPYAPVRGRDSFDRAGRQRTMNIVPFPALIEPLRHEVDEEKLFDRIYKITISRWRQDEDFLIPVDPVNPVQFFLRVLGILRGYALRFNPP